MRETLKPILLFSISELSIFTITMGISNILRGMQPNTGGHDFENGGVSGFVFGMGIAIIICAIHSSIFTAFVLAGRKFNYFSVVYSSKVSILSGVIFSLSLFVMEQFQNMFISLVLFPMIFITILIVGLNKYVQSKSI